MFDSKPSLTAQSVASNILYLSSDPVFGKLVPAEAVTPTRWFLEATPGGLGKLTAALDNPLLRSLAQVVERLSVPGISVHNAVRKCWIEEQVRDAIGAGITQVVVLGAGFDTLAYRLHRQFSEILWLEIDHPATLEVKQRAFADHEQLGENYQLLANDFTKQSLADVLEKTKVFNYRSNTVFIMEGLLMYLPENEVRRLFKAVHRHSGFGSRIVGTALEDKSRNDPSGLNTLKLQLIGEPYLWRIAPEKFAGYLRDVGFRLVDSQQDREVIQRYLPDLPEKVTLPGEEFFFVAKK